MGVNYTKFYSRQVTAAGQEISGGPTSLSLPVSVGPVGTVGVAWQPFNRVVVILSGSASWVNTRLTTNTAGILRTSHVEFNPGRPCSPWATSSDQFSSRLHSASSGPGRIAEHEHRHAVDADREPHARLHSGSGRPAPGGSKYMSFTTRR